MPLVYQQNINESTKMGVWHIAEAAEFFLVKVPLQLEISHPHKRLQHLAGRYLLPELIDGFPLELILIADTKKPFLADEAYHFSVSHAGDYAAVIISSTKRVGVDIEIISEKASTIRTKFLTRKEQQMLETLPASSFLSMGYEIFTLAWSIKETMFKWGGQSAVDFKRHMQIDHVDLDGNQFAAHCFFLKNGNWPLKVQGLILNNNVLTWTVSG